MLPAEPLKIIKTLPCSWLLLCFPPRRIREAAKTHKLVEQELAHSVNATALVLTEAKLSSPEVSTWKEFNCE